MIFLFHLSSDKINYLSVLFPIHCIPSFFILFSLELCWKFVYLCPYFLLFPHCIRFLWEREQEFYCVQSSRTPRSSLLPQHCCCTTAFWPLEGTFSCTPCPDPGNTDLVHFTSTSISALFLHTKDLKLNCSPRASGETLQLSAHCKTLTRNVWKKHGEIRAIKPICGRLSEMWEPW